MARHNEKLVSQGIAVFVIGFGDRSSFREMRHRLESPFQFLRDTSRHSYELMGLQRSSVLRTYLHPDVVKPYVRWALNRRFPQLRRGQDRRQLGGDFVILRTGEVVYEHRERGPEDRPPVGEVAAAALSAR